MVYCLQRQLIEVGLHLETDHSRPQLRHFGMYYHVRFILLQIYGFLRAIWKRTSLGKLFINLLFFYHDNY